jgi:hypothetical protein
VAPGSHDKEVRVFGSVQQSAGGAIPNKHSLDVHAFSSDGLQRLGLDPFRDMKGVITASVLYRGRHRGIVPGGDGTDLAVAKTGFIHGPLKSGL